jgi:hypothetical protein
MPSARTDKRGPPPETGAAGFRKQLLGLLLAVIGQDLIASLGELGAILLQAAQNDKVGVVHHRTAEFLDVVSAGLLLLWRSAALLLLGDGPAGDRQRQQSGYQESFTHCVPLILTAKILAAEIF